MKIIADIFGLKNKGIHLNENTHVPYQNLIELFHREGEPQLVMTIKTRGQNKGIHRMSLPEP